MSEETRRASESRTFAPSDRIRRAVASEGEQAGNDYFVLDLNTGKYYSLGEVGGLIWDRLDGTGSLSEIAQEVVGAFEVADREAESDVLEFVATLENLGLIESE